ncbi:hypothetical protein AOZ07_02955 [Glutamicibacter halophytocola]|uniref:hypothetical protein n=1 Tax=Glutamicibacter halophytocola TaxID=1933880 RepID=UPI0006D4AD80|nr:hypothetical protein [Glutamicibacter halophytocola]ALG28058.1 hypothetical protein AOZ07_02955 [Glutamicibacter halophytocola]
MTTDELITRARRAIETRQPRIANMYMRKALEQTDQKRRELNPIGWQARQLTTAFESIGDGIAKAGQAWAQIFESFAKAFAPESEIDRKSNYALAGPRK